MTIEPKDVRLNAFMSNLGSDWIAVSPTGEVLARADTEDAVRRAAPEADAYFEGSAFKDVGATAELVGSAVTLDEALDVVEAAAKSGAAFDHDGDGKAGGSLPKSQRKPKPVEAAAKKPVAVAVPSRKRKPAK